MEIITLLIEEGENQIGLPTKRCYTLFVGSPANRNLAFLLFIKGWLPLKRQQLSLAWAYLALRDDADTLVRTILMPLPG